MLKTKIKIVLNIAYGYLGINNTEQDYTIQPNIFNEVFSNDEGLTINQNSNTPLNYYGLISEIIPKNIKSESVVSDKIF